MLADPARSTRVQDADLIARAVAAPALAALAVIHVVDLPGTLGPTPLVGIGYLGIIAAAVLASCAMLARSHWLAWTAAGGLAAAAMGGYVLTRALPGGFLGDHGDVGNWRCPLGIAALSVETLIILLAAAWAWWARDRAAGVAGEGRPAELTWAQAPGSGAADPARQGSPSAHHRPAGAGDELRRPGTRTHPGSQPSTARD